MIGGVVDSFYTLFNQKISGSNSVKTRNFTLKLVLKSRKSGFLNI